MDKELFESKLAPLGKFKRRWAGSAVLEGYEDIIFVVNRSNKTCPNCDHFVYSIKEDRKNKLHWQKKCIVCYRKTIVKYLVS